MHIIDRSSDLPLTTGGTQPELVEQLVAAVDAQLAPALRQPWREVRIRRDSPAGETFKVEVRY